MGKTEGETVFLMVKAALSYGVSGENQAVTVCEVS